MGKKINNEELLEKLKWFCENNELITYETISKNENMPHGTMYCKRFGTLKNALSLVGQDVDKVQLVVNEKCHKGIHKIFTREVLIELLKDYYNKFGFPTTRQFNKNKDYPNYQTYNNEFGNFKNALIESGIEIPKDKQWLFEREEYTEEELLKQFKIQVDKKIKENGKLLRDNDINRIKEMPSASCYYKKFKTLDKVYELIGINRKEYEDKLLEEDMKKKYIEIRNILGRTPNSRDIERFSNGSDVYYGCTTYLHHFKSMHDFHIMMGDRPTQWSGDLTDEEMLESLVNLSKDLGIVPTQNDLLMCEYTPNTHAYTKRFGSFVEAIIKAGMTPRSNKVPLITPNGNRALSGYEYKFLLMLEKYNIKFKKEELYRKHIKTPLSHNYRFDFTIYIDNKIYFIEIFGMVGKEKYDIKTADKILICKQNNIKLIDLYGKDIAYSTIDEIYDLLINLINEQNIKELDA